MFSVQKEKNALYLASARPPWVRVEDPVHTPPSPSRPRPSLGRGHHGSLIPCPRPVERFQCKTELKAGRENVFHPPMRNTIIGEYQSSHGPTSQCGRKSIEKTGRGKRPCEKVGKKAPAGLGQPRKVSERTREVPRSDTISTNLIENRARPAGGRGKPRAKMVRGCVISAVPIARGRDVLQLSLSFSGRDKPSVSRIMNEHRGWISSTCLLYTSPSPRDRQKTRMPSSA